MTGLPARTVAREGEGAASPGSAEKGVGDALAELVAAIGSAAFPARFLAAMRAVAGVELCSVFRRDQQGLQLLFAEGDCPPFAGFPLSASRDYARGFWRSDPQVTRLVHCPGAVPAVVRRRASEIADPRYRAACYDRAGITERVSILGPGRPGFIANGYRSAGNRPFSPGDIARLEDHARLLVAAIERHHHIVTAGGHLLNEAALVEGLLALRCGLSIREAEISAAMILGETQEEIALRKQLSPHSIVTYRRRAYGKLGIASRRDLVRLHRRLTTDGALR